MLFHNLDKDVSADNQPNLLVCTCMDFRISLNIPPRFAYILRIAGSNASYLEFQVAFAISVGDIKSIAIIGHDDCAMAGLSGKRQSFIDGMNKNAGWSKEGQTPISAIIAQILKYQIHFHLPFAKLKNSGSFSREYASPPYYTELNAKNFFR